MPVHCKSRFLLKFERDGKKSLTTKVGIEKKSRKKNIYISKTNIIKKIRQK